MKRLIVLFLLFMPFSYCYAGSAMELGIMVKGDIGVAGQDGALGANGYTPVKNVDYFDGEKGDKGDTGAPGTIISTVKTTADINQSTTTLANIGDLVFPVTAGNYYTYEFYILFQSAVATNGLKAAVTYPAATVASYRVGIPIAADGAGGEFQGWGTTSGDAITGTAVQTVNTTYLAYIWGNIVPSANGNVQAQYASEVATNTTTIKQGSFGRLIQY